MRSSSSPLALICTFLLGACTTVALQSAASNSDEEPAPTVAPTTEPPTSAATVIGLDDAPMATAPSGKATITHLARGQNAYLGRLTMNAGGAVPVHRDATEEYIHVLEGGGSMTIDGQQYEIGPGTTVYMPANAEVSFQNADAPTVALQVFAGPEPAAKYDGWTGP